MDFNFNKYEGLSQHHKHSARWLDNNSASIKRRKFNNLNTSLHISLPKGQNTKTSNNSTLSLELFNNSASYENLNEVAVISFRREMSAFESDGSFFPRKSLTQKQSSFSRKLGMNMFKSTCGHSSGCQEARRSKEITELKQRIINLPTSSVAAPNKCLTKVIGRLTNGGYLTSRNENQTRKSMNFRFRLKRPQLMKEVMRRKIQTASLSTTKTNVSFQREEKETDPVNIEDRPSPAPRTFSSTTQTTRNFLRSKYTRVRPSIQRYDPFEIEPWKSQQF